MYAAPSKLEIDCYDFVDSLFWGDYQEELEGIRKKQFVSSLTNSSLKMDLVIPFLKDFLSSVEVLELDATGHNEKTLKTVPYILMHNIVTSKQPRLKHLKVNTADDITEVTCWMLSSVVELLCKTSTRSLFLSCSGTELALHQLPTSWRGC